MKLGDKTYPITGFSVWFVGPLGLCTTLEQALDVCASVSVDPNMHIRPISVAVTDTEGVYEQV